MIIDFDGIREGDNIRVSHTGPALISYAGENRMAVVINKHWFYRSSDAEFEKIQPLAPDEVGSVMTIQSKFNDSTGQVIRMGTGWYWLLSEVSIPDEINSYNIISVDRIGI